MPGLCLAGISSEVENLDTEGDSNESGFADLTFGRLFTGLQRFDLDFDSLHARDVSAWHSGAAYRQVREGWNIEVSLGYTDISIDYSDPVGGTNPIRREDGAWSGSLTFGKDFSEDISGTIGFSTYDGYNDYASVWISAYYDQFVGLPDPVNYREADPHGDAFSAGLVWDYDPGVARLSFSASYGNDEVVPAWSLVPNPNNFFIPEATPTRSSFDTYAGSITWAKALNPRLRTQVTFRFLDVTELDPRYQLQNDWTWAVTDQLTLRAQLGGAIQDPDFEALYGGLSLSYEFNENWSVGLSARIYDDTGEIVPEGFNTAAPAVTSKELGASIAWRNLNTTVRLSAGIYDVDYDALPADNQFFGNLYRDREFTLGRLAISHQF
ncbi:MAG: hypothetical protein ACN4GG_08080 [Akkermansiaceae bacterium]